MTTIDERVVALKFDNSQFEQKAQSSIKVLEKLRESTNFKGASKGLETLGKSAAGFTLNGFARSVGKAQSSLSALEVVGITALSNITNSAINAGKELTKAFTIDPVKDGFREYELKMGSMQTIMASTGAKEKEVSKYLEELNLYADRTIYSFSDMTENIGKFTNAGVSLKDAVAAIKGISNEAAVSGANAQQASHAMYNFAQALSSGYVKLIDWKSIENAQMATVEFKNELVKTAYELGTLRKEGDMYVSTTTDMKGAFSDSFDALHGFNDSLSHQWMTTDVLTTTLAKYANEHTKFGKKVFAAAQDIKTFSQMMDTLKEAAGSGWAQSFEIMFGSFNSAKKLWTGVGQALSNIIDQSAKTRNSMLKTWKAAGGQKAIIKSVKTAWKDLSMVMNEAKAGFESVVPPMTGKRLANISKSIRSFIKSITISESSLEYIRLAVAGFASPIKLFKKIAADAFDGFKTVVKSIFPTLDDFFMLIGNIGLSVENVTNGFTSIYKMLSQKISPTLAKGIQKVIPNITGLPILRLSESFADFAANLTLTEDQMNDVRRVVGAVVSVFDVFKTAIQDAGNFVLWFARLFNPSIDSIFALVGALADVVKSVAKFILNTRKVIINVNKSLGISKKITTVLRSVVRAITNAIRGVSKKIGSITDSFDAFTGKSDTIKSVSNAITGLAKALGGIGRHSIDTIVSLAHALGEIGKGTFGAVGDELKLIFEKVSFKSLKGFEKFKKALSDRGIKLPNLHLDKWKERLDKVFSSGSSGFGKFASNLLSKVGKLNDDLNARLLAVNANDIHTRLGVIFAFINEQVASLYRSFRATNIGKLIGDTFDKIGGKILDTFANVSKTDFVTTIKNGFDTFKTAVKNFDLSTTLKNFPKWLVNTAKKIKDFVKQITKSDKPIGRLLDGLSGVGERIKDVFGSLFGSIGEGASLDGVADTLSRITDAITNFIEGITPAKVAALVFAGFVGILAFSIVTLVNSMSFAIQNFGVFMSSAGSLATSLKTLADNFANSIEPIKTRRTLIREVADAVAILAGALILLSRVPADDLKKAGVAMAALAGGLAIFAALLSSKLFSGFSAVNAAALIPMAGSILILVGALAMLSKIDMSKVQAESVMALVAIVIALGVLAKAITMGAKNISIAAGVSFLAFAASLYILVGALQNLANVDFSGVTTSIEQIGKVFILLIGLGAAAGIGSISGGLGLLLAVAALNMALPLLEKLTSYDYSGIVNALKENIVMIGIATILIGLVGKFVGSGVKNLGTGLVAMGAAIILLTGSIMLLGQIDASTLKRGLKAVSTIIIMMTLFTTLTGIAAKGNYKGLATAMIGMSVSIAMLITSVYIFGTMNKGMLKKGITAVTSLMIFLGLFNALSATPIKKAQTSYKNILAAAAGITLVGVALFALGQLSWGEIARGLVGVGASMAALVAVLAVVGTFGKKIKTKSIGVIAAAALALGVVGLTLFELSKQPWDQLLGASVAMLAGMISFVGVFAAVLILGKAGTKALSAIPGLLLALATIGVLAYTMNELAKNDPLKIGVAAAALSGGLLSLAGTLAICSVVGAAAVPAIAGVGILFAFAASILAFVELIGSLNVNSGGKLSQAAEAFGDIIGSFVAGIANAVTSNFGEIGKRLGEFATNAQPFFDMAGTLDSSKITSIGGLFKSLGELSFKNKLDADGIVNFAEGLVKIKDPLKEIASLVQTDMNPDGLTDEQLKGIESIAKIVKSFTKIANDIPNEGGALSWIVGDNTLEQFAEGISAMVPALYEIGSIINPYSDIWLEGTLTDDQIKGIGQIAKVIKPLVEIANDIPNEGGVLSWLVGDNTFAQLGEGLSEFIPSLIEIGNALTPLEGSPVKGLNESQIKNIGLLGMAIKPLVEIANDISNEGGALAGIVGDNSLAKFGLQLTAFVPALKQLGTLVGGGSPIAGGGISEDQIAKIAMIGEALKAFGELANELPETGGLGQGWGGTKDISAFANQLAVAAPDIEKFFSTVDGMAGYDTTNLGSITDLFSSVAEITSGEYFFDPTRIATIAETMNQLSPAFKELIQATSKMGDTTNLKNLTTSLESLSKISGIDINFDKLPKSGKQLKEGSKAIKEGAEELDKNKSGEKVKKSSKELKEGVDSFNGVKTDKLKGVGDGIKKAGKSIKDAALDKLKPVGAKNLNTYSESIEKASKKGETVKTDSVSKLTKSLDGLKRTASGDNKEIAAMGTSYHDMMTEFKEAGGEVNLEEFIAKNKELEGLDYSEWQSNYTEAFENYKETVGKGLGDAEKEIEKSGKSASKKAEAAGKSTVKGAEKGGKKMGDTGKKQGANYTKGVSSAKGKSKTAGALLSSNAASGARNSGGRQSMFDAGAYVGQGYADGIRSKIAQARIAAAELSNAGHVAVKSNDQTNSPSKVYMRFGQSVVEGYAKGISKYKPAVKAAVKMSTTAVKTARKALNTRKTTKSLQTAGEAAANSYNVGFENGAENTMKNVHTLGQGMVSAAKTYAKETEAVFEKTNKKITKKVTGNGSKKKPTKSQQKQWDKLGKQLDAATKPGSTPYKETNKGYKNVTNDYLYNQFSNKKVAKAAWATGNYFVNKINKAINDASKKKGGSLSVTQIKNLTKPVVSQINYTMSNLNVLTKGFSATQKKILMASSTTVAEFLKNYKAPNEYAKGVIKSFNKSFSGQIKNLKTDGVSKVVTKYNNTIKTLTSKRNNAQKALKALIEDKGNKVKNTATYKRIQKDIAGYNKALNSLKKLSGQINTFKKAQRYTNGKNVLSDFANMLFMNTDEYKQNASEIKSYLNKINANNNKISKLKSKIKKSDERLDKAKKIKDKKKRKKEEKDAKADIKKYKQQIKELNKANADLEKSNKKIAKIIAQGPAKALKSFRNEIKQTVAAVGQLSSIQLADDMFSGFSFEKTSSAFNGFTEVMSTSLKGLSTIASAAANKTSTAINLVTETAETAKQAISTQEEAFDVMSASMSAGMNLFEKFTKTGTAESKALLEHAQTQIDAYKEYYEGIEELEKRGLAQSVIDDLESQGVDAINYVRGFQNMTDEQLAEYNKMADKRAEYDQKVLERSLAKQEKEYDTWMDNITTKLAGVVGEDFIKKLKAAGVSQANFVSMLVKMPLEKIQNVEQYYMKSISTALTDFTKELPNGGKNFLDLLLNTNEANRTWEEKLEKVKAIVGDDMANSFRDSGRESAEAWVDSILSEDFTSDMVEKLKTAWDEYVAYTNKNSNLGTSTSSSTSQYYLSDEERKAFGTGILGDILRENAEEAEFQRRLAFIEKNGVGRMLDSGIIEDLREMGRESGKAYVDELYETMSQKIEEGRGLYEMYEPLEEYNWELTKAYRKYKNPETLLQSLRKSQAAEDTWQKELKNLKEKGYSDDVINYFKEQGREAAEGWVDSMLGETEEGVKEINELMKSTVSYDWQAGIDNIKAENKQYQEYKNNLKTIEDRIATLKKEGHTTTAKGFQTVLDNLKEMGVEGFDAIKMMAESTNQEIWNMYKAINQRTKNNQDNTWESLQQGQKEAAELQAEYKKLHNYISTNTFVTGSGATKAEQEKNAKYRKALLDQVESMGVDEAVRYMQAIKTGIETDPTGYKEWQKNFIKSNFTLPEQVANSVTADYAATATGALDAINAAAGPKAKQVGINITKILANATKNALSNAEIKKILKNAGSGIAKTLSPENKSVSSAVKSLANKIKSKDNKATMRKAFKVLGTYSSEGVVIGIKEGKSKINTAAVQTAKGALEAAKKTLGIKSPSKAFAEIGQYVNEGFAQGLTENSKMPVESMMAIATELVGAASMISDQINSDVTFDPDIVVDESKTKALNSMRNAIAAMILMANEEIDTNPVITPELDLTDVRKSAQEISSMVDNTQANLRAPALDSEIQNGGNSGMTFVQNNYSPKALDPLEIYRQTGNLFSRSKGMVNIHG